VKTVLLKRSRARDVFFLLWSQVARRPFVILRDGSPAMRELVRRLCRERDFDLLHATQLNMAQYVRDIPGIPKILDQENAVSVVVKRLYRLEGLGIRKFLALLEWRRLRSYEAEACRSFDLVLTVTEEDRRALEELTGGRGNFAVVPIGVDCEEVRPIPRRPDARSIISVGTMFWPPNADGVLWFAERVYPLIKAEMPGVGFYVVGARPPGEVVRLGEEDPSIEVTGYVEDIVPYLRESAVMVVPLRAGGGMRVKILDAFARGIPVVSTSIGCEGIAATPGEEILVADDPADFAGAVVEVMRDKQLARRLSERGRQLVEARYDWRVVYRRMDSIYEELSVNSAHPCSKGGDDEDIR
jgi:glycosyltransferase involved in cell wall biosynthesis